MANRKISLAAARVNAGFKQKDAADKLGVSSLTLLKWEKGTTAPRIDQAQRLADMYGLQIQEIFLPAMHSLTL